MSLILEALKKAERQHRMGEVPSLGAAHHDEPRSGSRWLGLLLAGAVAVGMLILGIYLGEEESSVQPDLSVPSSVEMSPVKPMRPGSAAQPTESPSPARSKREVLAPQKGLSLEPPVVEPVDTAPATASVKLDKPPVKPKLESEPVKVKTMSELPDRFIDDLPPLNIDIHSFAEQAGRSYVLINMEKYHEGDYLNEGPLLSEILPDGVILEYRGERFVLPIGNY